LPNEDPRLDSLRPGSRGNGKRLLRGPKLSTKGSSAPGRRRRRRRSRRRRRRRRRRNHNKMLFFVVLFELTTCFALCFRPSSGHK
jgi:hypothetical protein